MWQKSVAMSACKLLCCTAIYKRKTNSPDLRPAAYGEDSRDSDLTWAWPLRKDA